MLAGDKLAFDVTAQYLFGGSAVDSGVELSCAATPARFTPKQHAELTYGVEPKGKAVNTGRGDQGSARSERRAHDRLPRRRRCAGQDHVHADQRGHRDRVGARGRQWPREREVDHASRSTPSSYYIGLETKAKQARSGETFSVDGLVVDWNGKPLAHAITNVHVELVHLEADYGYSYDEDNGEGRYDRWLRQVPEGKLEAKVVNGAFTFDVTPGDADVGYLVRVKAGKAKTELMLEGVYPYDYYYGYGEGDRVDQHAASGQADAAAAAAREGDRGRQAGRRQGDRAVSRQGAVDGRDRPRAHLRVEGRHGRRGALELHAPRVRAERVRLARSWSRIRTSRARTRSCPIARSASHRRACCRSRTPSR